MAIKGLRFNLDKKVVILTGGLGLIGKDLITTLTDEGAILVVLDLPQKQQAISILRSSFPADTATRITYFSVDITDKNALTTVKDILLSKYKSIDVLINNAALNPKVEEANKLIQKPFSFETMRLDQWNKELEVNLTGTMLCCQVFGSEMKSGGSIINIASIYGVVAPDQSIYPKDFVKPPAYGVSKAGVINLTKYLAEYWGNKNVRVNAVVFGGIENHQNINFIKKYSAKTPLRRMAQLSDYEGVIVFLASAASAYATGAIFTIDGGWTAI